MDAVKPDRMNVGLPMPLVRLVDERRKLEPSRPSRAEFVKRAVEFYLEARPIRPAS